MKKISLWVGLICYSIAILGCIYIAFTNPKETTQELIVNHWKEYLPFIFISILGIIFMKIGDKDG